MRFDLRSLGSVSQEWVVGVTSALERLGVAFRGGDGELAIDGCLFLFDEVRPQLVAEIRTRAAEGAVRVLAICDRPLSPDGAFALRRAGAAEVMAWDEPAVAARLARWAEIDQILASPLVRGNLVGRSAPWIALLRQVIEVAAFTDASVLILGESGTGKELIARLIHTLDRRSDKRELVVLDCTTVVPELSGSEFFGHERGAFTGAQTSRDGAFALADGGTLFLDEVGELGPTLQAQLLRVVQERAYKRVGSHTWHHASLRLILATHRDLESEVSRGTFRHDFFHRIATWICRVPPLGERPEDIVAIAEHFVRELSPGTAPPEIDDALRRFIVARPYPGNVRELRNLTARILKRHVGPGPLTVGDIPEDALPPHDVAPAWPDEELLSSLRRAVAQGVDLREIGRVAAETSIRLALDAEDGNLQRAARRLGVTDRALQMRRANRRP